MRALCCLSDGVFQCRGSGGEGAFQRKTLEGKPCDMKDHEFKVEEVDESAVVRFAGKCIGPPGDHVMDRRRAFSDLKGCIHQPSAYRSGQ